MNSSFYQFLKSEIEAHNGEWRISSEELFDLSKEHEATFSEWMQLLREGKIIDNGIEEYILTLGEKHE